MMATFTTMISTLMMPTPLLLTSVFEGLPIPYSPKMDDGITIVLLCCFLVSAYVLARSGKLLMLLAKEFMLNRERVSIFATTATDMRYMLLLVLQTCTLAAVCSFGYFEDSSNVLSRVSPLAIVGIYFAACLMYLGLKWVTYTVLGWMFLDNNHTRMWMESYYTLLYHLGFVLFPFAMFIVYFDLSQTATVIIGFSLIVTVKILMFYKWLKLFCTDLHGLLHLILYFCALEIIPCLMAYQGVIELNSYLIIKN